MSEQLPFRELQPSELDDLVTEIDRALDACFLAEVGGALGAAREARQDDRGAAAAQVAA